MTFTRLDLLPNNDVKEARELRDRWQGEAGEAIYDRVMTLIRAGAGEDFLQYEFEAGKLDFIRDQWDLAGMQFFDENITFPEGDSFENIDFSFAKFWHSTFDGACFPQTHFSFASFYNVTFKKCVFMLAHFYGCRIQKCTFEDCSFVEGNGFSNCEIDDSQFNNCFIYENIFRNCKFNENVRLHNQREPLIFGLIPKAHGFNEKLEPTQISGIYKGVKDGFSAGEVVSQMHRYLFLQRQAYTRFNSTKKFSAYLWEYLAGYGLRPLRVLATLIILFFVFSAWFWFRTTSLSDSLLLTSGAFLTFGAKTNLLDHLSFFDRALYMGAAFIGMSLTALFVTVLANVLLKDR
ncbi:MAG: pentapeptide repeat-containing protein [Pseudomonadota bacterium]